MAFLSEDTSKKLFKLLTGEGRQILTTDATSKNNDIIDEVNNKLYGGGLKEGAAEDIEKAANAFVMAAGGDQNKGFEAFQKYVGDTFAPGQEFELYGQKFTAEEISADYAGILEKATEGEQWANAAETFATTAGAALVEYLKNPNKPNENKEGTKPKTEKEPEKDGHKVKPPSTKTDKSQDEQFRKQNYLRDQGIKYGNVDPASAARIKGLDVGGAIETVLSRTFSFKE